MHARLGHKGAPRYNTRIMHKRPFTANSGPAPAEADEIDTGVDENGYDRPSKSQLKRDMTALQELGSEITELSKDALKKVPMPEKLEDAIRECRRITSHEGRRRQVQYIGRVMRNLDETEVAAIRLALDKMKGASRAETAKMHAIERWREQLLKDDAALTEFIRRYAHADVQEGRTLIRNARRESEQNRSPRYFRELFQWIKSALDAAHRDADAEAGDADVDDDAAAPAREEDHDDYYRPE
jgi:ribosome-associated protein